VYLVCTNCVPECTQPRFIEIALRVVTAHLLHPNYTVGAHIRINAHALFVAPVHLLHTKYTVTPRRRTKGLLAAVPCFWRSTQLLHSYYTFVLYF
jgi:hypothetical protein